MPDKKTIAHKELGSLKQQGFDDDTISKLFDVQAKSKTYSFTKEQVRQNAFRVMAVLDKLSQSERLRVLNHSIKLNNL